jgi:segregation and condensation protein A
VQLHDRALEQERIFTRDGGSTPTSDAPLPLHEVGIFQLIHAFQEVIKRAEAREDLGEIFSERFSVSDKIEKILERVGSGTPVRFSELFGQIASRVEIVVTFLALLELIRLNQVRALQRKMFDEIEIAPVAA